MKHLKERVKKGEVLFGCFLNLGSSLTAEIVGLAGFDWVLVDLEHGAGGEQVLLHQLQALEHTPAACIVRVESLARQRILRVLDLGAEGVMVPRIDNGTDAATAISGMRYPPLGVRGVATMNRACAFGSEAGNYVKTANASLLGVIQIETEESVRNIEEIANTDGADVLFVGPNDLSYGMGIPGQFDHPRFKEALSIIADAAQKAGKVAGAMTTRREDAASYIKLGYRFLGCGSDGNLLDRSARQLIDNLRNLEK